MRNHFSFWRFSGLVFVAFLLISFIWPQTASASASLTVSSASLATDGKTITVNIGGVSGSLTPTTGLVGFTVKVGSVVYPTSTPITASGSTVTIVTSALIATSTTVTIDLSASPTSNLTDDGGNTPQGQTGQAVTNFSGITLTSFDATNSAIQFSGVVPTISSTFSLGARNGQLDVSITGTCANLAMNNSAGNTFTITVDEVTSTIRSVGSQQKWSLFCELTDTAHRVSITSSGGALVSTGLFQVSGSAPALSLPTDIGNIYNLQDAATQNSSLITSGWAYDGTYLAYKTYWPDEKIKFTAAPTKISIWIYNKSSPFYLERDGVVIASTTTSGASTWGYITLASDLDGQTHTYSIGTGGYASTYSYVYGLALVGGTLGTQPSSLSTSIGGYGDSITAANQLTGVTSDKSFVFKLAQRSGVNPINRGIGGSRVIGSGDTRYADITGATPTPSYVTILYGINDVGTSAAFLTSYTNMLNSLTTALPTTKFMIMGLLQNAYTAQRNIDIRSAMTANGSANLYYLDTSGWTLPDMNGNHPGVVGYANMTNYITPYVSTTGYTVSGPSSGLPNVASTDFTLILANSGTFDGAATSTITIAASNGTITATAASGSITNNGTATVTVKPAVDTSSFTFTYTPTTAGAKTLTFTNGPGWTNPSAATYTALDAVVPAITLTPPSATVSGSVTLSAVATDDVSLSGVKFYHGTTLINDEVTATSSPDTYTTSWDTTGVSDGSYSLIAVARDSSNNYATSSPVTVTVVNTVATPTESHTQTSGSSVSNQVSNLLAMGNQQAADKLKKQYPYLFANGKTIKTNTSTKITQTLSLKAKGSQVKLLQQFLNNHGFLIAKKGAGSLGKETTYFGQATKKAVIRFQKAKGIKPASGVVGPLTRKAMGAFN